MRLSNANFDKPNEGTGGQAADENAAAASADTPAGSESESAPAATPPVASPDSGSPNATGGAETPTKTQAAPAAKEDWRDARIAKLTHDVNEARRALNEAKIAAATPTQNPGESAEEFNARVNEAAAQLAARQDYDRQCNAAAELGRAEFSDFDARIKMIMNSLNNKDESEVQAYNEVVATALDTGSAHKVLYALGGDLGELQRMMKLSPARRAMEIGKMASKLVSDPEPSNLPKPITPVGSSGKHYEAIAPDTAAGDKLSTREWMKRREAQAKAARIQ